MSANQPTAAWSGIGDPLVVVAGHLVSPRDGFGEIGRMPNGNLRRPNRISAGSGGIETLVSFEATGHGDESRLNLRRTNGTEEAPTAIASGDVIGSLNFRGFDGTSFGFGARIRGIAAENWVIGAHGTELRIRTVAIGAAATTDRWIVQAAGHLVAATDNVSDIGASGANRPRNLHIAGTSNFAGDVRIGATGSSAARLEVIDVAGDIVRLTSIAGGAETTLALAPATATANAARIKALTDGLSARLAFTTGGSDRWGIETAGHLIASTDNVVDVGASGANRPRDFFLARNMVIGGALNHEGTTMGVYSTTPITQQTGVAVSAAGIHAACVALGLFTA